MAELTLDQLFGNVARKQPVLTPQQPPPQPPPSVIVSPSLLAPQAPEPAPAPAVPAAPAPEPPPSLERLLIERLDKQNEILAQQAVSLNQLAGFFLDLKRRQDEREEADARERQEQATQRAADEAKAAALFEAEQQRRDKERRAAEELEPSNVVPITAVEH